MAATLTSEERLEQLDQEVVQVKDVFVQAVDRLRERDEVDDSFDDRLTDISERLASMRHRLQPEDYDKDQIIEMNNALWALRDLLEQDHRDLDVCDQMLVSIERLRHVVRDALDEHVTGARADTGLVLDDLEKWLPGTAKATLAELAGVDRRTLARWKESPRTPPRRLALVAQLVAILRRNWTEEGIVAWFSRPRKDLNGKKPVSLLDEAGLEPDLISAARSGRSQYAG